QHGRVRRVVLGAEYEIGLRVAVDVSESARRVANREVRIPKLGRKAAADCEMPGAVVEQKPRCDVVAAIDVPDVNVGMSVAIDIGGTGGVAEAGRLGEARGSIDEL